PAIKRPGQSHTLTCTASGLTLSSNYMAWIRQPLGKGLEWIAWHDSGTYKDSLKNKFSISLDSSSNTVTLTGQNMQPEDTAVYYCLNKNCTLRSKTTNDFKEHPHSNKIYMN
uniref:Ig-like domain-containing protein n=1 Tax=Astatotilapia calliptera TaxID=8154 RepID=A0A3P8NXK8_ASTCA